MNVETVLYNLIQQKIGKRPQPHYTLAMLEIDSLAMAELTCEIEQAFKIKVGDDIIDVADIIELTNYIIRLLPPSPTRPA